MRAAAAVARPHAEPLPRSACKAVYVLRAHHAAVYGAQSMRECMPATGQLSSNHTASVSCVLRVQHTRMHASVHAGRPHHWVTPFLGKRGQIGLSRHNFAATAPLPDLSTPLDSLYFSGQNGALWVKIGAVSGRQFRKKSMLGWKSVRYFPHTSPNSDLEIPADVSKYPAHPVLIWAWAALLLSCALRRGRC